ncbi:unnamed protein product, partial [Cuscuta europaea]
MSGRSSFSRTTGGRGGRGGGRGHVLVMQNYDIPIIEEYDSDEEEEIEAEQGMNESRSLTPEGHHESAASVFGSYGGEGSSNIVQ